MGKVFPFSPRGEEKKNFFSQNQYAKDCKDE